MRIFIAVIIVSLFGNMVLSAQTHAAVPVDHAVYSILDQAETRGLCAPLPAVKPYTRARIMEAINEILSAEAGRFGALTAGEKAILENIRKELTPGEAGLDLMKGLYRFDITGKNDVHVSADVGVALESMNSGAFYMEDKDLSGGTDTWGTLFVRGDIGRQFSFDINFSGGLMKAGRALVGEYDTYASELEEDANSSYENQRVSTYSQPRAFFPYSYPKNWDGFMFNLGSLTASNMEGWPEDVAIGPRMLAEMSGSIFGDMLLLRFGRIRREWGGMMPGSSLVLNAAARPFTGIEANFNPAPWFGFSSLTGVLEFDNGEGIKDPAMTFQSAYSIQQVELNYKNYVHVDLGSSTVWAKRFELGYLFPLIDNFIAQNLMGDFDNIAVHLNIKGRYPGLGSLWFSVFVDEMEIASMTEAFERDRHMFAYQGGLQGIIPGLPFSSLSLSYTKIEPYNYTHTRVYTPWYGKASMQTAYVNNGLSLGHYLPPNSDEIKLRFDTRPWLRTAGHIQYQLIRHGADYGPHQVDGSSLVSELDPSGRSDKDSLKKAFLKDGAYQWMHIVKVGAEYTLPKFPLTFFGEAGVVYSYFTDISDSEYARYAKTPKDGREAGSPAGEYLTSTAFILSLGFRIYK